ncbi:MAG: preprotein translocase subunit SecA, partial [Bacteroides sp.]
KKKYFSELDYIKKYKKNILKNILDEILPEAFAIIKETALRFKNQDIIIVNTNDFDKKISLKNSYVKINNEKSHWHTNWNIDNSNTKWNMDYYDEQIIGAIVLHQGKISEMRTGEGKTLVAVCTAYLNALSGNPVHVITVNEYLSKRDYQWMKPILEFHGLLVECIDNYSSNSIERINAYNANIIYGTNKSFGFDYLRSNMVNDINFMIKNDYYYAIIDEVDSVLIDEARTPLVISGPSNNTPNYTELYNLNFHVKNIYHYQIKCIDELLVKAQKYIKYNDYENGGFCLLKIYKGFPNYEKFIKYISNPFIRKILNDSENKYLQQYNHNDIKLYSNLLFIVDEKNNSAEFTDNGINYINKHLNSNFFILPDVNYLINKINRNDVLYENKKQSIINKFNVKSEKIHYLNQLLKAYTLFHNNKDYIIQNNKIIIIDPQTGRISKDKRYSDGIHQAIEAKENVKIEKCDQTLASITLQNFFKLYDKICGMTGTASTEINEFWTIYKLDVITIPTHLPVIRLDKDDLIFKTKDIKYQYILKRIIELHKKRVPILVGTTSVKDSELISSFLKKIKIKHNVLNAKYHDKEASIIKEAGIESSITIATNMAGRGTDIKISDKVRKLGGLFVLGTERHESRRIDNQLIGRSGRQGDPGVSQFFISLQDDLMRLFGSDRIHYIMNSIGYNANEIIQHKIINNSIEKAQKKVENSNFHIRKRLIEYDDVINYQRNIIYSKRYNTLLYDRIDIEIYNSIIEIIKNILYQNLNNNKCLQQIIFDIFGFKIEEDKLDLKKIKKDYNILYNIIEYRYNLICKQIISDYNIYLKNTHNTIVVFSYKKRQILINLNKLINDSFIFTYKSNLMNSIIDFYWKKHLRTIDYLKTSVQNVIYEQKDPLLIYKIESFKLFDKMILSIYKDLISFLFNSKMILYNKYYK